MRETKVCSLTHGACPKQGECPLAVWGEIEVTGEETCPVPES